jgi:DNA repair protein SbcD/Mre11
LKFIHTSDLHLGHTLQGISRELEHAHFLAWLIEVMGRNQPDLLLITGDVFDTSTPSATAEQQWYGFLAQAKARCIGLETVVIAGNHDSPSRLMAPAPVLAALGVTMVATVPRLADHSPNWNALVFPVCGDRALIAAVPFLRAHDLSHFSDDERASGKRDIAIAYQRVAEVVAQQRTPAQALIVLGHLYAAGGVTVGVSERPISVGGQDAAPPSMFPADANYVALGHLHRGQRVGADHVRYAGSPIPLAMAEASYCHHVVQVEIEPTALGWQRNVQLLEIPRQVEMFRIPTRGSAVLSEVLPLLAALPETQVGEHWQAPFLEVHVLLTAPEPKLRSLIEQAIASKWVRLVSITPHLQGDGDNLSTREVAATLQQVTPEQVFLQLWARNYGTEPSMNILHLFRNLVQAAESNDSLSELPS